MSGEADVVFYIPASAFRHEPPPTHLGDYREWVHRAHVRHFAGVGKFNWILQTYLHLAAAGVPCRLSETFPAAGVVITHRFFLPDNFRPNARQLVVCVLADKEQPGSEGRHPFAQHHLLQNPADPLLVEPAALWPATFVPFWTQIDLIERSLTRGDQFSNIAFFGIEENLAPELKQPEFLAAIAEQGYTFRCVQRRQWHDFSAVDVVLAIRSFDAESYHWKPATKLFNAWRAGVPAIVGHDSAYEAVRRGPLDFLRVDTLDGLHAALRQLTGNPGLRQDMAANGRERAKEIDDAHITRRWAGFIAAVAIPHQQRWCGETDEQRADFFAPPRRRVQCAAGGAGVAGALATTLE